ncbi:MAG: thioesterase family protein [Deltaproteobacteria bacterium]|jgi:fluoroacetyl-CoA thioesterase|nr:thioesterase family protein [Deltaproteobacteria bacterium]MCW9050515.1 thioesterase family protein [Deltaproteobacteria bacterium]
MKASLTAGTKYTHEYTVPNNKTVPYVFEESELFQQMPPVFATAFMVGLMEWACMEALKAHMEEDEISLGTDICVSHLAATPVGIKVFVEVECLEINGAKTKWSITARDEIEVIGKGTHERFTINAEKFARMVEKKAAG